MIRERKRIKTKKRKNKLHIKYKLRRLLAFLLFTYLFFNIFKIWFISSNPNNWYDIYSNDKYPDIVREKYLRKDIQLRGKKLNEKSAIFKTKLPLLKKISPYETDNLQMVSDSTGTYISVRDIITGEFKTLVSISDTLVIVNTRVMERCTYENCLNYMDGLGIYIDDIQRDLNFKETKQLSLDYNNIIMPLIKNYE